MFNVSRQDANIFMNAVWSDDPFLRKAGRREGPESRHPCLCLVINGVQRSPVFVSQGPRGAGQLNRHRHVLASKGGVSGYSIGFL
ncbi:hypothetical protein E2C01_100841 [Portunus trituberculatus]|uniref:Uncharacterized protein n=1 Tax=Portunus trituberculatus TaxID=210409 RepID=A0A5B7K930_PORTR|nr:hypothetical protein [Portunus trituberculatus]